MFLTLNKTNEEISADILKALPSTYQKSVGFMAWDYARAISIGAFEKIYNILKYLCSFGDINNFEYDDLAKFVFQRRGIVAKKASKASGILNVTGTGEIKEGDIFETPTGLQFYSKETKIIEDFGTVMVECSTDGALGNVPANSITVMPITISGIITVTNSQPLTNGYDKETKKSIIERYLEDIQRPITSNNKNHFKKWAKECTGVGDAIIKPLWNGDNTVKVILINSNYEIADNELVNSVQKYIDPFGYQVTNGNIVGYVQNYYSGKVPQGEIVYSHYDLKEAITVSLENEYNYVSEKKYGWGHGNGVADCGAYVKTESAKEKNIVIEVDIILKSGTELSSVVSNIEKEIKSYLKTTVFNDTYISYAKIGAYILKADDVLDYDETSLKVNGAKNNIMLANTNEFVEVAVLKKLEITEIKKEQA